MEKLTDIQWDGGKPTKPGWYATIHSWDVNEGSFLGAAFWAGEKWDRDLPITSFAGPFPDEEAAEEWGEAHDATW